MSQLPAHWDGYAKVPDRCKYNYDEEAANATKGRLPGLLSEGLSALCASRAHAICADGKMAKHFTDGFFSRSDGKPKAPFAVKAVGGKKKTGAKEKGKATGGAVGTGGGLEMPDLDGGDSSGDSDDGDDDDELPKILPSDSDGLRDCDADDGQKACIGLGVTRSGSMVRRLFPALCRHFVATVLNDDDAVAAGEPRQGKGGEPVLLIVDGHASRWSLSAILYLLEHNVFAFCLPSHTSMCAVPLSAAPPHLAVGSLPRPSHGHARPSLPLGCAALSPHPTSPLSMRGVRPLRAQLGAAKRLRRQRLLQLDAGQGRERGELRR